jgi:hypothetical protein
MTTNTPSIKDLTLMKKIDIINIREQIQEDIICLIEDYGFLSHPEFLKDNLCQIVVDNFKKLEN